MPQFDPNDSRLKDVGSINDASNALGQPVSTEQMKQIIISQHQANQPTPTPVAPVGNQPVAPVAPKSPINTQLEKNGLSTSIDLKPFDYDALVSDTEEQGIRDKNQDRLNQLRAMIGGEFDTKVDERRERGGQEISGAEARLGISRGLGASSSRMQFVQSMKSDIEDDVQYYTKQKAEAMAKLDFDMADRADKAVKDLEDTRFKVQKANYDMQFDFLREQRAQSSEDRTQTTFEQKQEADTIDSISGSLYSTLTGDLEKDQKLIDDAAKQYGIDPNALITSLQEVENEESKFKFEQATKYFNLSKQITEGETKQFGDITIEGSKKEEPDIMYLTKTVGNNQVKIGYDMSDIHNVKEFDRWDLGPKYKPSTKKTTDTSDDVAVFNSSMLTSQSDLRQGKSWGTVWNALFKKYKTGDPAQDEALGKLLDLNLDKKKWSEEGAYQNQK